MYCKCKNENLNCEQNSIHCFKLQTNITNLNLYSYRSNPQPQLFGLGLIDFDFAAVAPPNIQYSVVKYLVRSEIWVLLNPVKKSFGTHLFILVKYQIGMVY